MIILPDDKLLRILAIDNGSTTLGASITDVNLDTEDKTVIFAETVDANRSIYRHNDLSDHREARFVRYRILYSFMAELLEEYNPNLVAIESPFMFKRPEAFAVLREAMLTLQQAVDDYDPTIRIELVPPAKAKMAVGADEFVGKDPVRDAVLALNDVYYERGVRVRELDEHSIDSIAVMYYIANHTINHLKRRSAPKNAPTRRVKGGRRKRT